MPLEVQDSGKGVILETTASAGEKIPVDEAAKVSSQLCPRGVPSRVQLKTFPLLLCSLVV
jgi:hypothetical protein